MQFAKVGTVISGIAETSLTHTASSRRELMGRLELQFNGIPLLLGYIPVNREPRWGLLNGQLLMADVNTTDSRAKSFKRGVCTGSFRKFTFSRKPSWPQNSIAWLRYWSGKT